MELKNKEMGSQGSSLATGKKVTIWDRMWSLNVASKVKIFLRRAFHNFLQCPVNLKRRHLKVDEACFRCGGPSEDTMHCLWNCRQPDMLNKCGNIARRHMGLKVGKDSSFINLFERTSKVATQVELKMFGVIARLVWKNRNACRFGEKVVEESKWLFKLRNGWQTFRQHN